MKFTRPQKKILYPTFFVLLCCFSMPTFAFLKADGQEIVDSTGTPILLRGYGLGGWLVPEGYMLQFPGFGSPTDIRNKILDVLGPQNTDAFYAAYEANYVNRKDIEQIADWGFNSIRIPFHYKLFYDPATQDFREAGFALLDSLLDWCGDNGLYLILDMHCAPGGQNNGNISDSDGIEARLWTEPQTNQPLTINIWKEIARRYATDPRVGGYDLLNETVLPDGFSNQVLRDFFIQLTDSIRQIDTNHMIFIEGNWFATNFDLLTPPWDDNMAYSFHKYWSETDPGSIQGYLSIRAQHNVPLWMGESGENSNAWFNEAIRLFEDNNIGWCWWTHKKLNTLTSPYSAKRPQNYQTLLDYWDGNGTKPSQSFATTAMMELAENLKIENCDYRPGVIPALMDPEFRTTPRPFVQRSLPGQINAVEYDYGTQGIAYIDSDYKVTNGWWSSIWNNGWEFRNDGVDIERSQDTQGHQYNVGWIETGERLMYTTEIAAGGTYQAHVRVASQDGNGLFLFVLDGQPVSAQTSVPATGGWQNWTTVVNDSVHLTAGTHQLMILVTRGGFNLSSMTFFLTAVGIDDKNDANNPLKFSLSQNYPNPFNPATTIQYAIPKTAKVVLKIYDITGKLIETLVNQTQVAGEYSINWQAKNLPSGNYFYKLQAGEFSQTQKLTLLK